jgi:3-hydroxyisobutyrate dehydrogenase-like beta-hydroxyacid dehydrogenase
MPSLRNNRGYSFSTGVQNMKIGLIGLGQMGRGMAGRLLSSGYALRVWNRSPEIAASFQAQGAVVVGQPDDLVNCDVVITMLADDAAVEAVWIESGLLQKLSASATHLNMASVSLHLGQRLAALHGIAGTQYVSAPVFGRPEAAATGQLDIVAAGPDSAIARCIPLFEVLGRRWFNAGTQAHCANIESLGEAFALVQKSGVDPETFLDILTNTSMNCPAYKNYGRFILDKPAQATFPLKLGLKDVELALRAGQDTAVPLPLAALLREQHQEAIAHGYADREWASLGNYIAQRAGL